MYAKYKPVKQILQKPNYVIFQRTLFEDIQQPFSEIT